MLHVAFMLAMNESMNQVVQISKKNGVSIGAHPSFNDPENFGRQRMNLSF
jgi:UPF0271 protein